MCSELLQLNKQRQSPVIPTRFFCCLFNQIFPSILNRCTLTPEIHHHNTLSINTTRSFQWCTQIGNPSRFWGLGFFSALDFLRLSFWDEIKVVKCHLHISMSHMYVHHLRYIYTSILNYLARLSHQNLLCTPYLSDAFLLFLWQALPALRNTIAKPSTFKLY